MFCWVREIGNKMGDPRYFQLEVVPPKHNFSSLERKLGTNKKMVILSLLTITTAVFYTSLFYFIFLFLQFCFFFCSLALLPFFCSPTFFFPLLSFPFVFHRFCWVKESINFLTGARFWSFNHSSFFLFSFCWKCQSILLFFFLIFFVETRNCVLFYVSS